MTASSDYTLIASPDAVITDAQGNVWSIQNGQVAENGIPDPTTANVIALAYAPGYAIGPGGFSYPIGQVWQENASLLWWAATGAGWSQRNHPEIAPVSTSPDGKVITPSNPSAILEAPKNAFDSYANVWTIIDGQVVRDGVADPTTANVIALEYKNGVVWQENADQLWWSYSQASDGSTIWTPGTLPVARTWIGGGDNNAANPDDWSPTGVPDRGDTLTMRSGTMNICGNALAGYTLKILNLFPRATATINLIRADASIVVDGYGNTVDINASSGTSNLSLEAHDATVNVQVDPDSTLVMNASVGISYLNVSGGTIEFIGNNHFDAFQTVFNDRLTGTATINESGGIHAGQFMEVNGPVGCGLTFNLSSSLARYAGANIVELQIDHPESFHGTINTMQGVVVFMGLHVTSGEILDGMLELFDGDTLVNKTRFTGQPSNPDDKLHLTQISAGVLLSVQGGSIYPSDVATTLPLTISS